MTDNFSQNDLVQVTREIETTPGVVVGGARDRLYGTAPTWTPGGSTNTSGINTGDGGVVAVRAGLRYADANLPSELVYGLNHKEWEDALRDNFPVSPLVVSAATVTFAPAGTQLDGSTGPTITAVSGTFAALYSGDAIGLMMEISGASVSAANKRPRPIKAIKADGTQIDVEPLYCSGSVGQIGEPLTSQATVTATIMCGRAVRNRGIQNSRTINHEYQYTDQPGGSFQMVRGLRANGLKLAGTGKGNVTFEVPYVGLDYDNLTTVTQGNGTVNPNLNVYNDPMTFGEDLAYFLVGGVTQLAGHNITSFNLAAGGNVAGIDDTGGTRNRPGSTAGDLDFTGSLKIYHVHAMTAVLQTLGRNGNRVPLDMKFIDPAGNFYWMRQPKTLFEPNGPVPGAKNAKTDDPINFKTQLGVGSQRTFILQAFDHP